MLAGNKPALAVAGVAVRVVRGLSEDADRSGFFIPAHDAVVGGVAPKQIVPIAEPDRALAPAHACGETLHAGDVEAVFSKAGIKNLDRRVWIAFIRLPSGERSARNCRYCNNGRAGDCLAPC